MRERLKDQSDAGPGIRIDASWQMRSSGWSGMAGLDKVSGVRATRHTRFVPSTDTIDLRNVDDECGVFGFEERRNVVVRGESRTLDGGSIFRRR